MLPLKVEPYSWNRPRRYLLFKLGELELVLWHTPFWIEYFIKSYWPKRERLKRTKIHDFKTRAFDSFFDTSTGKEIWQMDQIRDQERQGKAFLSHREAQQEYKRNKEYKERKFQEKSKELFKQKLIEVDKGYRYSDKFKAEKFSQEALHRHLKEA